MINITEKQYDDIIGFISPKDIIDDIHRQSLQDYVETFDFTTFADGTYAKYLGEQNRVIIPAEDVGYREFIIEEVEKYHDEEGLIVEVYSSASFLLLKKANILEPQTLSALTPSQLVGRTLNETEWTPGIIEATGYRTMHIDQHTNPFAFLKRIATEFDVELRFRVETNGNRVTGRYVDLIQRTGVWQGREVEFGKDLIGIERIERTDNVYTALVGLGPVRDDDSRLEIIVEDREALQRWGRPDPVTGELRHLWDVYEPESSDQNMTEERLYTLVENELEKRVNEVVEYESSIADLEHVPGMENKKIRFGDTIKIKDTKFNPPLYLEARVFEQERSITDKGRKTVKLGDFVEYTEEQVMSIWQQLRDEVRRKISAAEAQEQLIQYTYDRLTIDNKDETTFENGKTFAESVGTESKEYADSKDEQLRNGLEEYADNAAELRAIGVVNHLEAYAVAQEVYDIQMQNIADDIGDRAPIEYVDGRFSTVEDLLDDFNTELDKKADGSTVYTISEVDNMINNTVSITKYTEDMDGVVTDLESHGTRIGQNEEAIGLKADASDVDTMEQNLITQIGNVEVKADSVITSVSEVRADLDGLEIGGRNLIPDSKNIELKTNNHTTYPLTVTRLGDGSWEMLPGNGAEISTYFPVLIGSFYDADSYESGRAHHVMSVEVMSPVERKVNFLNQDSYILPPNKWVRIERHYPSGVTNSARLSGIRSSDTHDPGQPLYYRNYKFELGSKATDWSPAPEDMASHAQVTALDASIETLAGKVNLKASQSELDTLTGEVETLESELSVLPDKIRLSADRIDFDGHVFGEDATFTGKIEGSVISGPTIISRAPIGQQQLTLDWGVLEIETNYGGDSNRSVALVPDGIVIEYIQNGTSAYVARYKESYMKIWDRRSNDAVEITSSNILINDNEVDAIVSQGSNSNGEYIRYSSGVQICWIDRFTFSGGMTPAGNIYRCDSERWTFPMPFINNAIVLSGNVRSYVRWFGTAGTPSTTGISVIQFGTNGGSTYGMSIMAIGRWK